MEIKRIFSGIETLFYALLLLALALAFLMHLFVFIINWEAYFFGVKLAGPRAGACLFASAAVSFVLLFLLVQYPKHRTLWTVAAVAYFGFAFLDSSVTIRSNTGGAVPFSYLYAVLLAIPLILLLVSRLTGRSGEGPVPEPGAGQVMPALQDAVTPDAGRVHPFILLLICIIGLMVVYILVIPFAAALYHTQTTPGTARYDAASYDTLVTKIDPEGRTTWQVSMSPCNILPLWIADGSFGGYLVFGASERPDRRTAIPYLVMLDPAGTHLWNWSGEAAAGEDPVPVVVFGEYLPEGGYRILLSNRKEVVLDMSGSVTRESISSEEIDQRISFHLISEQFVSSPLPAHTISVRVRTDDGREKQFILKDALYGRELWSINAVHATEDGGYLVSASA